MYKEQIHNRIFWQNDKIGLLTNHLEADTHAHWMLQLFISIEDRIEKLARKIMTHNVNKIRNKLKEKQ